MISEEKLFGNWFDSEDITSSRLALFARDAHNRFITADIAGQFTTHRTALSTATTALETELGDVSGALAIQKGKTATVDTLMESFKDAMTELEGVIAYSLGGKNSAAFIEMYPNGVGEYRRAIKTDFPPLLKRVSDMAVKNTTALGAPLTTRLKGYATAWKTARDAQQQQKGSVGDNRADRSVARVSLERVLMKLIHAVGEAFPGDVEACKQFFKFSLLDAARHSSLEGPDEAEKKGDSM